MRLKRTLVSVTGILSIASVRAAATLHGQVVDSNGNPVAQAQVILTRAAGAVGASVVTVFSDANGKYHFPDAYGEVTRAAVPLAARALGYKQVDASVRLKSNTAGVELLDVTLVVAATDNQVEVAPASAWLNRITDRKEKAAFVMNCIDCHQVPGPEQRSFAGLIADVHTGDPKTVRTESWKYIVKYMNYLSGWEFSRGSRGENQKIDPEAAYSVKDDHEAVRMMTQYFPDRLDHISGYQWGAPLAVNGNTTIWEYEVPHPNAIREAMLLGGSNGMPRQLWIADVASNNMIAVDIATGKQQIHTVPSNVLMSPHSMHRDHEGDLWITPLFNSVVAYRNLKSGEWKTWALKTPDGKRPGIHDLSFGYQHELLKDDKGRVWYSDIGNNSVGYFDPKDGSAKIWPAPPSPDRAGRTALYGLSMTKNRKQVWYSQLGNGTFGGFDIEKQEFIGPFQFPDRNAGPRRISIDDNDVLYLALYGSGQLAEFDTKTRKMIGVYDLPDTGSTPYSTTWDPVRKVVWITVSNNDVIFRFDPKSKSFSLIPLPRQQTFLRMVDVDPKTGVLITSYANIVDIVQGPRMALIVDPGDNVYPEKFGINGNTLAATKKK